ncbi:ADP-ribosylglycohydrolase family protein [Oceaniglobus ichthyenteri]|uniref:ADP-ribosylglycohydrolase family protein n=1 Tax=Oceaniglobus ichthyenteri TaxID=2136177 RepID=UPI000D3A674F|nr:ADP-ribosylglycohydrolase family protein [Oceaniglobus ichthyenteri]
MDMTQRKQAALMGALVADAAALGAHWIYDPDRIATLRARFGRAAFIPVDPAHYEGGVGYFAHASRETGMPTQYGAVLALAIASIRRAGGFDRAAYQSEFAAFFGAGGAYQGYIDRPTRGALANIAADQTDPSGIDDDQLPAIATLPAVIVAHYGESDLLGRIEQAISVTNVNDVASAHGATFAQVLSAVIGGMSLNDALSQLSDPALRDALNTDETDSTVYGGVTGRACHLPMAMPLAMHILTHATSYQDAVERNIAAGGDSAGRAIIIGALAGAAFGLCTENGVPLQWILQLRDGAPLWEDCRALAD